MAQEENERSVGQNLGRELSTRMVMFHQVVAERFELSITEHKCLEVLYRQGALTAGQLAAQTGLTTGAITKIVDRLEQGNFVKRARSQTDRRQVILTPVPERAQAIGEAFTSLSRAMARVAARYSEEERALIFDYLNRMIAVLEEETARLQNA